MEREPHWRYNAYFSVSYISQKLYFFAYGAALFVLPGVSYSFDEEDYDIVVPSDIPLLNLQYNLVVKYYQYHTQVRSKMQ